MHPRIIEINKMLDEINPKMALSNETLKFLSKNGVSIIEACFAISIKFDTPFEKVCDFVYSYNIFPYLEIQEAFAQTMEFESHYNLSD